MHRKERVIAPLLASLKLQVTVPSEFNTDRFGTFSREIARSGTQLEAARQKVIAAMELTGCTIGIASEGSFGPHPAMPFLPSNRELVILLDRQHNLEVIGEAISTQTNYRQTQVRSWEAAWQFAQQVGFPSHGLIVIAGLATDRSKSATSVQPVAASIQTEQIRPEQIRPEQILKGITDEVALQQAFDWAIEQADSVWLETDMRAHYNPTRMGVIQQATQDLIAKLNHTCPNCGYPGFAITEHQRGLPCELCGQPTASIRSIVYGCQHCGFQQTVEFPDGLRFADPTYCEYCNP
jgi:ribosomal protein S27AE